MKGDIVNFRHCCVIIVKFIGRKNVISVQEGRLISAKKKKKERNPKLLSLLRRSNLGLKAINCFDFSIIQQYSPIS